MSEDEGTLSAQEVRRPPGYQGSRTSPRGGWCGADLQPAESYYQSLGDPAQKTGRGNGSTSPVAMHVGGRTGQQGQTEGLPERGPLCVVWRGETYSSRAGDGTEEATTGL